MVINATGQQKTRLFYEYAIWDVIDQHNAGSDFEDSAARIMVSEGRYLHDKFIEQIESKGYRLDSMSMGNFMSEFNEAYKERLGGEYYSSPYLLNYQRDNFMKITGFSPTVQSEGRLNILPLSPYDSQFSNREALRLNGSSLSGVQVEDVSLLDDITQCVSLPVFKATFTESDEPIRWRDTGVSLVTSNDVLGLTPLMGYMTSKDYSAASDWLARSITENDYTQEMMDKRALMTAKSVAILRGLGEAGIEYSISPDTMFGQLTASLQSTKINVRVMDTPDNSNYIGRVYDNGVQIFYSTTKQERSASGGNITARHETSPEDCLTLVRYALGEPIFRWDNAEKLVGEAGLYERQLRPGVVSKNNNAYRSGDSYGAVIGDYVDGNGQKDKYGNKVLILTNSKNRSRLTVGIYDTESAENYLRSAVDSARENFESLLDAERLIKEVQNYKDDESYLPVFSGNVEIAMIQQGYWNVLTEKSETLLKPSTLSESYQERLSEIGEILTGSPEDEALYKEELRQMMYDSSLSAEEKVKQHSLDAVNHYVGSYDLDENGKRFNPVGVSTYQTSPYGVYRNNDDIVAALRLVDISGDELKGNDFYNKTVKTRLIKFDKDSAVVMKNHESSFIQGLYDEVRTGLISNGAVFDESDVLIDSNGIVQYKVSINKTRKADGGKEEFVGEFGQIFIPDERGILYTQFAGGDNYASVPGYEASIVPQKPGERKSVEERTKLRGYEQILRENIRYRLRQDFISVRYNGINGEPTSINNTYRRLYDTRYDLDFIQQYQNQGMPLDVLDSIIETQSSRVRYSNTIRDGSTINAHYRSQHVGADMSNDNFGDTFVLTGGRNMAVLTSEGDGYFDQVATTSTSTNQGTLRFLTKGSKVDANGFIIPGEKDGRCSIMEHDIFKYSSYDPFDRQCMTLSNLMQASAITKPVNVAQMTFGGWNFDDPIIVSKSFADAYPMKNKSGEMRSLVVGDKLSDFHGNKGVIALIIDPEMDLVEAEKQGIKEQVEWFKANPEMDLVMAPFPALSRFNGGTAREMMVHPKDLVAPDGTVYEGALGSLRMIVTDKSADAKTHIYDDEEVSQGKGRRVSGQLAWSLNSKDCSAIMSECFGPNSGAVTNLRELLITTGLDMDEQGFLRVGYAPHEGEVRNVIEMPEIIYNLKGAVDMKKMRSEFGDKIANSGGVLEIPFPMKYPTGEDMPPLDDGKRDVIYTTQQWEQRGYTRKDGTYVKGSTHTRKVEVGQRKMADETYGLPILSSYLRSGQSFDDGTSSIHDYTNHYLTIFEQSVAYRNAKEQLKRNDLADDKRANFDKVLVDAPRKAQVAYDRIVADVKLREFEGKYNVFRDKLMSRNMPNSATAIISADPRLALDEVSLGDGLAEAIGVQDGDYVLIWRDPQLRDSGTRYMKCKIDSNLTGIAINPVMDKPFDGDFDGDTFGVLNLQTEAAKKEAMRQFSVDSNLLDKGHVDDKGLYSLSMQNSLDVKVAIHENPELKEKFDELTSYVNDFESWGLPYYEVSKLRQDVLSELSELYSKVFTSTVGKSILSYKDIPSHIQSVWDACIETGAKGSPSKVKDYMRYLGVDGTMVGDDLKFDTLRDKQHTLATRDDAMGVQMATAVKSFGTGVAGKFAQRAVMNLRNDCITAALELSYPVTQSILQAKHDPAEAVHKYNLLMSTSRDLWRGYKLEEDDYRGGWKVARNAEYKPIQATKEEWKKQFIDFYTSKEGLNVEINPMYVDQIANTLSEQEVMVNIEADSFKGKSFMDEMAYEGSFKLLYEGAKNNRNVFEGKYNSQFMPYIVKQNIKIVEKNEKSILNPDIEVTAVKAIVKSDVVNNKSRKPTISSIDVSPSFELDVDEVAPEFESDLGL